MRLIVIALVVVSLVLTSTAYRRRKIIGSIADTVEAVDRYVDIGVTLRVVRVDPNGTQLIQGARPMVVLREYNFGGILDTKANPPRIVEGEDGLSRNPQVWYCSEDQEPIILHRDSDPVGKLALGGMGAGKTTAGVIWTYRIWLENIYARVEAADAARARALETGEPEQSAPPQTEMGVTAPTETRLDAVFKEMFEKFPSSWRTFNNDKKIATMCDRFRIRGVSTHKQSASQGSRIQAFNWIALFMDELQDQTEEFVNAQARLRSKADGRAKRYASATAKDHPEWRSLKTNMDQSGLWSPYSLLGPRSPFIHPDHWAALKAVTDDREYRRLVLAEDLPPESRLYYTFDRKENVRPIPIGAKKITSYVISRKTNDPRHHLLIGHDPGEAKAASVFLDAYDVRGEVWWWVRGELFTLHASAEEHATKVLDLVRKSHGVNIRGREEIAHVRSQPLGGAEDKPDLHIKRIWERVGFDFKFAQYAANGQGCGQIKKEARISVVKALFCNAESKRRLFIECDDRGAPVAPLLVNALETMERDAMGRPERDEKNVKHDKSDLPAALGYALWPFEKESAMALRDDIKKGLG